MKHASCMHVQDMQKCKGNPTFKNTYLYFYFILYLLPSYVFVFYVFFMFQ